MSRFDKENRVTAKACGVRLAPSGMRYFTESARNPSGEAYHNHRWSIEKAECREVFRNWWLSSGKYMREVVLSDGGCVYFEYYPNSQCGLTAIANELTEADCIVAIVKATGEGE
jgi:hypothetical protein